MKTFFAIFSVCLVSITALSAAPLESKKNNCTCSHCTCIAQDHCGCMAQEDQNTLSGKCPCGDNCKCGPACNCKKSV